MNRFLFGMPVLAVLAGAVALRPDSEVARLQKHFATVEAELRSRDLSGLTVAQRIARSRQLHVLHEYARAGVFPHNHDYDHHIPYFKDEHGTLCAVGYLIAQSGREGLAERVARTANHAYLPDLARDPELRSWLDENGLTVEEAARIQPAYGPVPGAEDDAGYEIASIAASVISGGAITWTLLSDPKRANYAPGLITSVIGLGDLLIAAGGALSDMDGGMSRSEDQLTTLNALVGTVTLLAGITHVVRVANARSGVDATETPASSSRPSRWQPVFHNDLDGRTRLGVNVRF